MRHAPEIHDHPPGDCYVYLKKQTILLFAGACAVQETISGPPGK